MNMYFRIFLTALCVASYVRANTEIVNFEAEVAPSWPVSEAVGWPVLGYGFAEGEWSLQPAPLHTELQDVCEPITADTACPHEVWLALDLDSGRWGAYYKFTLRISWPASSPADFLIEVFDAQSLSDALPHNLTKYARIRLVDTGVRTPSPSPDVVDPVPFVVLLEPLFLGVLPLSVAPTVGFLLPLVLAGLVCAHYANAYLSRLARQAGLEIEAAQRQKAD